MKLEQIKKAIASLSPGNSYKISGALLGGVGIIDIMLDECFKTKELALSGISKNSDNTSFSGMADSVNYMNTVFNKIKITFAFEESNSYLLLQTRLDAGNLFDPFGGLFEQFKITCCEFGAAIDDYSNRTSVFFKADFKTGSKVSIPVSLNKICGSGEYFMLSEPCKDKHGLSFNAVVKMLDAGEFEKLLPQELTSILDDISISRVELSFNSEKKQLPVSFLG